MRALRIILPLFSTGIIGTANAQQYGTLDVNDVIFKIMPTGHIGRHYMTGSPTFTVPAEEGTNTIYIAGLWASARTNDGQLKTAIDLYGAGTDFFPGPLTVTGDASITPEVSAAYDHVWNIRAVDVERHRAYFNCLSDPECDLGTTFPEGYVTPQEFITWPAMGDTDQGQAQYLAPFFDYNMDGSYSALDGDHPCIPGDQALFSIFNDNLAPHTESSGDPIGVETHVTSFAYTSEEPALEQTVFMHYKIINRSSQVVEDMRVGLFMDADLGCATDDFIGTDVGRSLFYVYNWDDFDQTCNGAPGYGPQPPAFGMVVLRGLRMDSDEQDNENTPSLPAYNGTGFNDGLVDNERYGLCGVMQWFREGFIAVTDPTLPIHFDRFLRSTWKNGVHLTYGGSGYSEDPLSIPCDFFYPGDSDSEGIGSNSIPMEPWSEVAQYPLDRLGVGSIGSVTLQPGEMNDFLIAFVYGRAQSGGAIASVAALQHRVDSVSTFARSLPELTDASGICDQIIGTSIRPSRSWNGRLALHPVPVKDVITMTGTSNGSSIEVLDGHGKVVMRGRTSSGSTLLHVDTLNPGVYTCRVIESSGIRVGRFVKE